MYLQLTTRCNYECPHCCFSCTRKGIDMTMDTFVDTVNIAKRHDGYVVLGGGEPMMHPQFLRMLEYALKLNFEKVLVITNGSFTGKLRKTIELARQYKELTLMVSNDAYHPPMSAATYNMTADAHLEMKNVSFRLAGRELQVQALGRALENQLAAPTEYDCCCDELFFDPQGNLYFCGCRTNKIGSINDIDYLNAFLCSGANACHAAPGEIEDTQELSTVGGKLWL